MPATLAAPTELAPRPAPIRWLESHRLVLPLIGLVPVAVMLASVLAERPAGGEFGVLAGVTALAVWPMAMLALLLWRVPAGRARTVATVGGLAIAVTSLATSAVAPVAVLALVAVVAWLHRRDAS